MKNIKKDLLAWISIVAIVGLWIGVLYFTNTPLAINQESLKKLPEVVSLYVIGAFVFTQWLWKWRIFQGWLVPYPNLNGTWEGTLASTWKSPETNQDPEPIKALLVVKQSFSRISCVVLTEESESFSTAAQIDEDDDSGILRLSYTYVNKPRAMVRERSQIHYGAAIVKIVKEPEKLLDGQYWTDRKTTGEMEFSFRTSKRLQNFSEDALE